MAGTHLWVNVNVGFGVLEWHKAVGMWRHSGSSWVPVVKQWINEDGASTWRAGYDTAPGPVATLEVLPASNTMSRHTTQDYICNGYDADGVGVFVDPASVSWAVSRFGDSIDAFGTLTAGGTNGTGTVTATVGALSAFTPYTVTF